MIERIMDRLIIILAPLALLVVISQGVQMADRVRIQANRESGEEFAQGLTISMELEDKVGQLIITTPEQLDPDNADAKVQMTEGVQQMLENYPVSGVILQHVDGTSKRELQQYAAALQEYSEDLYQPLMVAIAEEGLVYDPNADGSRNLNPMWFTVQLYGYESNEATQRNIRCIEDGDDPATDAIAALNEGADLLYVPENMTAVYDAILAAVKDGTISEERLNECLYNALMLKFETGLTLHARGG